METIENTGNCGGKICRGGPQNSVREDLGCECIGQDYIKLTKKVVTKLRVGEFPGAPVVKSSPSNVGGACLMPGHEAKILYVP